MFLVDRISWCFFVFCPIRRSDIWSATIWIYFVTFITQYLKTKIEDKLTNFHRFQIILITIFEWIKKFFYNFICFIIMISMLWPFECITRSSSLSMEEIKLFAIVSWIFHVSGFFRLFMVSFKCGLILLRYSSANSVLFLSPLLSYSI